MELRENPVPVPKAQADDKEAWSALKAYKCYCCQDTGYVVRIERVLRNPHLFSRPILCQRVGCAASAKVQDGQSIVDRQLTPEECRELHEIGRDDWLQTEANWHQQRQKALLKLWSEQVTKGLENFGRSANQ